MILYLLRRVFLLAFVFIALSILAFSLGYLFPGDPLQNFTGLRTISAEQLPLLIAEYRMDQGYIQQYLGYLQRIISGDWGLSFASQQLLLVEIKMLLPATLELAAYALLISFFVGIPLGIIAAIKPDGVLSKAISALALTGYSLPIFWWALLLIMVFSLWLGWLPTAGRIGVLYEIPYQTGFMLIDILLAQSQYQQEALFNALRHLLLPTLVLATFPTTVMIRFTRDSMLEVWEQSYIKTARAKGLSRSQVLYRHGLRNALLPVTRQIGLQFSTLITLAMITEVIFSWPGIGRWLIDSIYQRNFPAIQSGLLIISTLVITVNMLTEVLHTLFNPLARKR
ncbi:MAG: ABC transporter permease subunit [Gammaproteobacteria bacterium]|nr:ABC transporter permease subunit [Gammaproteobacteria bacterium]MBU1554193.1 ABC transporter permease subunit [Gammaproteobacteria bacterium]MBU2071093.1 ABC transporter permease subunit [Gammaproteobacteria bacterium]MBU2184926.1 ABC transporter permease subunit [Gammaproteobacteria bacterium]MBU2204462.1 ABC transporter permease subunit [Gammaproteobacteria bacterium]